MCVRYSPAEVATHLSFTVARALVTGEYNRNVKGLVKPTVRDAVDTPVLHLPPTSCLLILVHGRTGGGEGEEVEKIFLAQVKDRGRQRCWKEIMLPLLSPSLLPPSPASGQKGRRRKKSQHFDDIMTKMGGGTKNCEKLKVNIFE